MCDPGTAALAISGVTGLIGARQQRQIGKQNAATARAEADRQEEIGRFEEQRSRSRMDRLIQRQRAQLASRGVRLDSASAIRLGAEAAQERGIEAQAQRFNTASQVSSLNAEADLAERRGKLAFLTGVSNTATRTVSGGLKLWPELGGA